MNCGLNLFDPSFVGVVGKPSSNIDDTDLKAYWKFNQTSGDVTEDSQAAAALGDPADLQITGATYNQSTSPFVSMLFDGVNDGAVAGTSLSQFNFMHNTSALWTVVWWMRANTLRNNDLVINTDNLNAGGQIGFDIRVRADGSFQVVILGAGGEPINKVTTTSYIPDTTNFYFYLFTYDQAPSTNNLKVHRDDANLEQFTKSAATPDNNNAKGVNTVGKNSQVANDFLHGNIAEMSVWNKVMSGADQTSLYNSGSGFEIY